MSDHHFHYPFSAYVTGILTYSQFSDALKSFVLDYPQQAALCRQQSLVLLHKQRINQQQYQALLALITADLATTASSHVLIQTKQPPRQALTVGTPLLETPLLETPILETPILETPLLETPILEAPLLASAQFMLTPSSRHEPLLVEKKTPPLLTVAAKKKSRASATPHYWAIGLFTFGIGCFSGYLGHHHQASLQQHALLWWSQLHPKPVQPSTANPAKTLTTTVASIRVTPSIEAPTEKAPSIEKTSALALTVSIPSTTVPKTAAPEPITDLMRLQTLLPHLAREPEKHFADVSALLQKLQSQYAQNTPEIQQARQALAHTYLQLARNARQQQQWQQAENFLAQSIAMRINPVESKPKK
jgi:hypothetical protein